MGEDFHSPSWLDRVWLFQWPFPSAVGIKVSQKSVLNKVSQKTVPKNCFHLQWKHLRISPWSFHTSLHSLHHPLPHQRPVILTNYVWCANLFYAGIKVMIRCNRWWKSDWFWRDNLKGISLILVSGNFKFPLCVFPLCVFPPCVFPLCVFPPVCFPLCVLLNSRIQ